MMVGLFNANILLMPCQISNQIFWMKWRFQPVKFGKTRRERVRETKKGIRKAKNPEVPGRMWKRGPTRLRDGHIFYFYQPLQSFNKMVASLNMDSCKFLAPTMRYLWNIQVWFFFFFFPRTHISLPHQKICFPTPCGSICIFLSD